MGFYIRKSFKIGPLRLNLFDRNSRRTGYGIQRADGSWDLFQPEGSRPLRLASRVGPRSLSGFPAIRNSMPGRGGRQRGRRGGAGPRCM